MDTTEKAMKHEEIVGKKFSTTHTTIHVLDLFISNSTNVLYVVMAHCKLVHCMWWTFFIVYTLI